MSRSFKLFRLQQIDSQLDSLHARLREIELLLVQDETLRLAQQRAEQAAGQLEQERKALRRAEDEVNAQRVKIEQTEATLYGGKVRNPKELQDMQHETAALKRYLGVLEDRQLEVMIRVEESEAAHAAAVAALEAAQAQSVQKNSRLIAERSSRTTDSDRLESERGPTIGSILPEDLALYEQLRKQRRGVAVAKVTDSACSACGSILNSALLHVARSPSQIVRCDLCGRILYGG